MKKINKLNINALREKFISDYSKKKGWNPNNLSPSQLIEIVDNMNYLTPKNYI